MQAALIWYIGQTIATNPQQTTVENRQCFRTRIAPIPELLLGLLLLCATVLSSVAGPFTQLVVFGDSLSDVGNISQATGGIYPGQYYYNNRFSNGPVYTEAMATGLDLPMVRSTAGGNNFAYGGAKTFGTGGFEGLFIRDIDEQVDQFLTGPPADPNALFLVFAGSNDIVGGQTNVSIPVNSLAEDIDRLIVDGARNLLVPNLPLLGYTPRFNGNPSTLATYNTRTQQFNTALSAMLDGFEADYPAITMYRFDTAGLFGEALSDPAASGLTNVTQPAAPDFNRAPARTIRIKSPPMRMSTCSGTTCTPPPRYTRSWPNRCCNCSRWPAISITTTSSTRPTISCGGKSSARRTAGRLRCVASPLRRRPGR